MARRGACPSKGSLGRRGDSLTRPYLLRPIVGKSSMGLEEDLVGRERFAVHGEISSQFRGISLQGREGSGLIKLFLWKAERWKKRKEHPGRV